MKENKGKTNSSPEGDGICHGYHVNHISKGVLGYLSKIQEELDEAKDFESQNNPVGVLLELSDLLGAVDAYLKKRHSSISLWDLVTMFEATYRSFACGERSKEEEKDFKWSNISFKYPGVTLGDTFTDTTGTTISSNDSGEQSWTCGQKPVQKDTEKLRNYVEELLTPKVMENLHNSNKGRSKKCAICVEVDCDDCANI